MSNISRFFKQYKTAKENTFYQATKSLTDEEGTPLKWEIKPISTKENERIQEQCTKEIPIPGKRNEYRTKVKYTEYAARLITASVVYPDLCDKDLQDSYGVVTAEDLVREMVDNSGEWNAFVQFINEYNEFVPIQEDIDEAKN